MKTMQALPKAHECPRCHAQLFAALSGGSARAGALSMCDNCGTALRFTNDGRTQFL